MSDDEKRRHVILIDGAWQGGSFPNRKTAEVAAVIVRKSHHGKTVEVQPKGEPPTPKSKTTPHAGVMTTEQLCAQFDEEMERREKLAGKAFDDLHEKASIEIAKATAAADELAKRLASADEEIASLRAAAAASKAPAEKSEPAATEAKSEPKKK